ncbi:MAG: ACT domain-containing protein [Oscillospiraceae bacterium]|nr:ACT domain-containing protein [Oscillospiraceae bacterium]
MSEPNIASGSDSSETRYAVVSCDVLPEVFIKVMEVKRLLACGEEKSSASACKRADISRSAFYKYRDSVYTYEEKLKGRTVSLYAVLRDTPGVLSSVLACLHRCDANVLTLNQSVPIDGAAAVTVTVKLSGRPMDGSSLRREVCAVDGVVEVRLISED